MCADRIRVVLGDIVDTKSYAPIVVRLKWRNYDQEADDDHHEWIYCTDDEANWMHFVEDLKLNLKYMLLIGPRAEEFEQVLRATVSNWPRDQILERAHNPKSRTDRCKILHVLALDTIERGYDQETFDIYTKALADPDASIRKAAVIGASYLGWPQLAARPCVHSRPLPKRLERFASKPQPCSRT